MVEDTIAAIATPLGEGGLAVVRVSGRRALEVADACFEPAGSKPVRLSAAPSHTLHYGHVVRDGRRIDEVLAGVLRAPRTFTREDTVEFSCHGGMLPAKFVLDAALARGARLAQPGEFTRRAFLNGRIDLAQAEAVADLIHARTELALQAAGDQLAGKLSHHINQVRDDLMGVLAHIEAHIDFPDEDIAPDTREQLSARLTAAMTFMDSLLRTAHEGQVLRHGIRAAIIGRPNVGKSSLLNQLLGHERAIVSPVPGTTRDTIQETANVRGLPVIFVDTAGLRESSDGIEAEGIRRSRQTLDRAELILQVFDASQPAAPEDIASLADYRHKTRVLVRNKIDLGSRLTLSADPHAPVADVSCVTGQGIEELKDHIKTLVWAGAVQAESLEAAISSRHQDALRRGRVGVARAREALGTGATLELVALDLRIGTEAVGEVVGKTATEDLLDAIFSQFCIGK